MKNKKKKTSLCKRKKRIHQKAEEKSNKTDSFRGVGEKKH